MEQQEQNNSQQQPQNSQVFKVRGMKTDFSESSFENSFAFENKNMRINIVDDDNTLLNLTNERGTREVCEFEGIPVGLKKYSNNKALLITTTNEGCDDIGAIKNVAGQDISVLAVNTDIDIPEYKDRIYEITANGKEIDCKLIPGSDSTDTNLSAHDPLEIEHYSDRGKDYFYVADGINNFKAFGIENGELLKNNSRLEYNDCISGEESISVGQTYSSLGEFFAGVMIYCFAYINKLGHKTGIIDISDLVYLTDFADKEDKRVGLEPNKRCNIANSVIISGVSKEFESIEIYSLYRASLDGEIVCKRVGVQKISETEDTVSVQDLNTGESVSYQELLSRFNSVLIPSTITQKSSSLFLANIKTNNFDNLKYIFSELNGLKEDTFSSEVNDFFLSNNQYFFGVQLQDRFGNWTPVMSIGEGRGNITNIKLPKSISNNALTHGYIAVRAMLLDNKRIRNTICEGVSMPLLKFEDAKYGIDYYSPYFYMPESKYDNGGFDLNSDIYKYDKSRFEVSNDYADLYSPDIEFNENLIINKTDIFQVYSNAISSEKLKSHNINIEINGNIGTLYNADSADNIGKAGIENGFYSWTDAITGYQKALQLLFWDENTSENISGEDMFLSLYKLGEFNLYEKPTKYIIYTWQPGGSLNDSNNVSILKSKRISRKYTIESENVQRLVSKDTKCYLFDGTSNNIPLDGFKVYGGNINQKVYPSSWKIDEKYRQNKINDDQMWDADQIPLCEGYSLATLSIFSFIGQPIEVYRNIDGRRPAYMYSALGKLFEDEFLFDHPVKIFRGKGNTTLGSVGFDNEAVSWLGYYGTKITPYDGDGAAKNVSRRDYIKGLEETTEVDNNTTGHKNWLRYPIKIRATNNYNRNGNINITYNTAKHLVFKAYSDFRTNRYCRIERLSNNVSISKSDIETGRWIVCSKKVKLKQGTDCSIDIDINEKFVWKDYECLKTEPHSLNDENQVTCCLDVKNVNSYINPLCRYDGLRDMSDYNGVTSSVFNKMNMVYNQKNNFFVFMGITDETVTSNNQGSSIMYTDVKVQSEKEDTFINFNINNFYDIDSNISRINKIITYNDKLLCFSDNAIVNVLYNENVVINTDSVQNLGLASSDKISGSQLLTNTYGCMNKWSVGISDNILYFNDDLNNKMMSFGGEGFSVLNESLGIETLNGKFLKKSFWNPVDFGNTKLNIDKYSKDIHYTANDTDISLNTTIGAFMSLFSYDNVSYMEQIGNHSIAIRGNKVYALREGDYNYFFGKYEPYWTTVILNNNSLANKTISNIEFNTEAYDSIGPDHNFTFDTIDFWNDYQSNSMNVDFKMYGQSSLKKKFRIWRVNMLRDSYRMTRRNTDMISNPWTYMRLCSNTENTDKLTLHWININYR